MNSETETEIVNLAKSMLHGKTELLLGMRMIVDLACRVKDAEDPVFMPIRAMESETDHFLLGDVRQKCASKYLERADKKMGEYMETAEEDILQCSRDIIEFYKEF